MIHLAFKSIFRNLSARKVGDKKPFSTPIRNVPQLFQYYDRFAKTASRRKYDCTSERQRKAMD